MPIYICIKKYLSIYLSIAPIRQYLYTYIYTYVHNWWFFIHNWGTQLVLLLLTYWGAHPGMDTDPWYHQQTIPTRGLLLCAWPYDWDDVKGPPVMVCEWDGKHGIGFATLLEFFCIWGLKHIEALFTIARVQSDFGLSFLTFSFSLGHLVSNSNP